MQQNAKILMNFGSLNAQENKQLQNNTFSYFCVPGLNMNYGDLAPKTICSTFEEALKLAKSQIGNDPAKCASIQKVPEGKYYNVWLKTTTKTNLSTHPAHWTTTTVFYGTSA